MGSGCGLSRGGWSLSQLLGKSSADIFTSRRWLRGGRGLERQEVTSLNYPQIGPYHLVRGCGLLSRDTSLLLQQLQQRSTTPPSPEPCRHDNCSLKASVRAYISVVLGREGEGREGREEKGKGRYIQYVEAITSHSHTTHEPQVEKGELAQYRTYNYSYMY